MKTTRTTINIILAICMLVITAMTASALSFTQYTPSPTSDNIITVQSYGYYTMALTNTAKVLFYNGTNFDEIAKPSGVPTSFIDFDKATDGKFYWAFSNGTLTQIFQYNPFTETWTAIQNQTESSSKSTMGTHFFACIQDDNGYISNGAYVECYNMKRNGTSYFPVLMNTSTQLNDLANTNSGGQLWGGADDLYITSSNNLVGRYNGVSWSSLGITGSANDFSEYNSNRFCTNVANQIRCFNQTTNLMDAISTTNNFALEIRPSDGRIYQTGAGGGAQISSRAYFPIGGTLTLDFTAAQGILDIDFDRDSTFGWIVGSSGVMYYAGSPTPPSGGSGDTNYSVVTNPSQNPAIYGTPVIFTSILTNAFGTTSSVTVDIFNSTDLVFPIYTWSYPSATVGQTLANSISGTAWTNFAIGQTYNVRTTASDGSHSASSNFSWVVTANATVNQTNYTATPYQTPANLYSGIVGVDSINSNRIFAVGTSGSSLVLISVDATNPNNLVVKSKNLTLFSGADYPTSISIGTDRAFIGTNDELYIFANMSFGDATQASQHGASYGFALSLDYIYDTSAQSDTLDYVCRDGTTDDERRFNFTSLSFDNTIAESPCLTVRYNSGILYIHKGTSGIKVYNATNSALLATITGISSQSSGATHDRISTFSTFMYAITGQTQISKYNVANPASPSKVADCYTNGEVFSLEAVSADEVIIGVNGQLRVCDFGNSDKFDAPSGKYLSTAIKTYSNSEVPQQIEMLDDDGKIAVAENNRIGVYQYVKSTNQVSTNNPPTITSITTSTNSVCLNQNLPVTIEATDPDTPSNLLTYDYDCDGVKAIQTNHYLSPSFSCFWTTIGTKTIKAWVQDETAGGTSVLGTKNIVVSNCTANTLSFKVLDGLNPDLRVGSVLVNVQGQTSGTTNSAGQVTFNLASSGTFNVTFSKTGYVTQTKQATTSNAEYTVYLEPTTDTSGASRNILIVQVTDVNDNPLQFATVSVTDPITTLAKNAQTDNTGTATFLDLATGVQLKLSAGKAGYTSTFTSTFISQGETKTVTVELLVTGSTLNQTTGRGCVDDIDGILLCSPLRFDMTGDSCTADSDCISGRCSSGLGKCSNFNWTYCDARGMARGQKCYATAIAKKEFQLGTAAIFRNFLYVLVFLGLAALYVFLRREKK